MNRIIAIFVIAAIAALALPSCSSLKLTPEERAAKEQADSLAHLRAASLLQTGVFMVQARQLDLGRGYVEQIQPNTTYLMVNKDEATLQVSPRMGGSANGVGGFTVAGQVTDYKVKVEDDGEMFVTFNLRDHTRVVNIGVTLLAGGETALVRSSATFISKDCTMTGAVAPYYPSLVIEGIRR